MIKQKTLISGAGYGIGREIAEKFATFFSATNPESFLEQFQEWDKSIKRAANPKSEQDESICWKKATKELEKITVKNVNL